MFLHDEESFMHIKDLWTIWNRSRYFLGSEASPGTIQSCCIASWDDNHFHRHMLLSGTQNFYSHVMFGRWSFTFQNNPSWSSTSRGYDDCLSFHSRVKLPIQFSIRPFYQDPGSRGLKHHRWGNKDSLESMWLIDLLPWELCVRLVVDRVLGSPQAQQLVDERWLC